VAYPLLPAFTVGLASYIAVLEGIYFATGREVYFRSSMREDIAAFNVMHHGARRGN
jgi:cytochrome bd-type quinol oxidase subunit 1